MKLTTFIKSYKIAMHSIAEKVKEWKGLFLYKIEFPDDLENNKLRFTFTESYNGEQGSLAVSAMLNPLAVEQYDGGLDSISEMTGDILDVVSLSIKYIYNKVKINDAGRIFTLLDSIVEQNKKFKIDELDNLIINSIMFNFDDDIADFFINKAHVYTNGLIVLFGD